MVGWIYLAAASACSAMLWLVARWSLRSDGRVDLLGFWGAPTAITVSLVVWAASNQPLVQWQPMVWGVLNGAMACLALVLIMTCVKIGPIGPTTTLGNLGFVWPVAIHMAAGGF